MNLHDQQDFLYYVKLFISWIAAFLGIGTIAGVVNILVGVLSATWLAYQLWVNIKYELPIKKARLYEIQNNKEQE